MGQPLRTLVASALVSLVLSAVPAGAQSSTGRISGTVLDSSGGVLPGVMVTVTQDSTGLKRSTTTDRSGAYVFVSLPLGAYSVVAELAGFKKAANTGYQLVADGRVTADFVLSVGAVTEIIEVTVGGETVNTVSGEIARVVDREQVQNLALNGRNYLQLATLIPGAPLLNDNALNIMTDLAIGTSINGSRTNTSLLTVDGGFNMDSGSNNSQISNVGIDFIEEVSIKTANFSAEYGRNSGANVNVVTRSGSNKFQGSVFEYTRNDTFDANEFFSNARGVEKSDLRFDDFGWSFGGPIRKDKLFFFAGEEWKRIRRSTTPTQRTLPTSAMRNGDFSPFLTARPGAPAVFLRDPLSSLPCSQTDATQRGGCFPGNIIPANRITPDGRAIANLYAQMAGLASSYSDLPISNNALFQMDNPFDFRQDLLRLDWQPSMDHRVTLRAIRDNYELINPFGAFIDSQVPTSSNERRRPGRNYQVGHTWSMSSSLINEFKANASWNSQRIIPTGEGWQRETYGFVYPQLFDNGDRFENSIPDATITGYASFNGAARSLISPTTDIQVSNNLTWLTGAHTIRTGGLVIRNRKDQNGRSLYAGQMAFDNTGTRGSGNAFADALMGNFRRYTESQYDPMGYFRFWQAEAFLSDNWRASRSLNFELGVRYAWHSPMYTQANNMASFDPARYDPARAVTLNRNGTIVPGSGNPYNGMVRAGEGVPEEELFRVPNGSSPAVLAVPAGAPRGFYKDQHLFAPRLSFAWTPPGSGEMAIRGGVGLFYDRPEGNLLFGGGGNGPVNSAPFVVSSQFENGNLAAPGGGSVAAPAPLGTLASIDPNFKVPRTWNYSASLQRKLPWGIFGEIGYVGAKGMNLIRQPDINQPTFEALAANAALPVAQRANTNFLRPYKGYSIIQMRLTDGDSTYNALQVYLSRREGRLRWTVGYTLSRAEDNASGNGDNPEDYLNKDFTWGPSDYDRRHILVGTWTWQLPFFPDEKGIGRVLGGWEISGIGRFQTGAPITVTANTSIGVRRADVLDADTYLPESEQVDPAVVGVKWLNPAAFAPPPEGRRGNGSRGQFRGPSYAVLDLSVRKGFAIARDVRLQIQADLFNALNHTNLRFSNQSISLSDGGFGVLNQAGPPRNVQLGARLTF